MRRRGNCRKAGRAKFTPMEESPRRDSGLRLLRSARDIARNPRRQLHRRRSRATNPTTPSNSNPLPTGSGTSLTSTDRTLPNSNNVCLDTAVAFSPASKQPPFWGVPENHHGSDGVSLPKVSSRRISRLSRREPNPESGRGFAPHQEKPASHEDPACAVGTALRVGVLLLQLPPQIGD